MFHEGKRDSSMSARGTYQRGAKPDSYRTIGRVVSATRGHDGEPQDCVKPGECRCGGSCRGMAHDPFILFVEGIHGWPGECDPCLQLARVGGQVDVLPRRSGCAISPARTVYQL